MFKKFSSVNQFIASVALCLLFASSVPAQNAAAPPSAQEISAKVDEYMNAAVRVNRFSGAVLVSRNGQPVVSRGYGMANIELGVPNTPQTVFRLGSVTKQFTGMA
ncbi:MAG TPA: serine hydrolase, partial [Pyrinomonadaceae bacterium]|nr:serine hydrolase [Pyrinomonadaceae bacterium]